MTPVSRSSSSGSTPIRSAKLLPVVVTTDPLTGWQFIYVRKRCKHSIICTKYMRQNSYWLTDDEDVDDDKEDDHGRYSGGNAIIRIRDPASRAWCVTRYVVGNLVHNRRQVQALVFLGRHSRVFHPFGSTTTYEHRRRLVHLILFDQAVEIHQVNDTIPSSIICVNITTLSPASWIWLALMLLNRVTKTQIE